MTMQQQPLGIIADTSNGTSYSLTPDTYPTTDRIILLAVESNNDPDSISGIGLTWTKRSSVDDGSRFLSVWEGTGTVSASGDITASMPGFSGGTRMALVEAWDDGGATPAIRRWGTGTGSGTSTSATLASTDTGDILIGFSGANVTAATGMGDNTNWSDGQEAGHGAPARTMRTNESATLTTSPSPATIGSSANWRCIVAEVYAESSGTTYDETGLSETIAFSDDTVDVATRVEVLSESVVLSDDVTDIATLVESLADTITLMDSATDVARRVESLSESIIFTINGTDSLVTLIQEHLEETIGFATTANERQIMAEHLSELIVATVQSSDVATRRDHDDTTITLGVSGSDVLTAREDLDELIVFLVDGDDVASSDEPAVAIGFSIRTGGRVLRSDQLEQDRDRERVSR